MRREGSMNTFFAAEIQTQKVITAVLILAMIFRWRRQGADRPGGPGRSDWDRLH